MPNPFDDPRYARKMKTPAPNATVIKVNKDGTEEVVPLTSMPPPNISGG